MGVRLSISSEFTLSENKDPRLADRSRVGWRSDQEGPDSMKRSGPLRRLTPLRARSTLRRSAPLERSSRLGEQIRRSTRQRKRLGVPSTVREEVINRDRGCRADRLVTEIRCWGPIDPHHVLRRSQGGPDTSENLISVCRAHHDWIHQHPARSYELGLLKRSGDA